MVKFDISFEVVVKNPTKFSFDDRSVSIANIKRKEYPNWEGWAIIDKHFKQYGGRIHQLYAQKKIDGKKVDYWNHIDRIELMLLVRSHYRGLWERLRLNQLINQPLANDLLYGCIMVGESKALELWLDVVENIVGDIPITNPNETLYMNYIRHHKFNQDCHKPLRYLFMYMLCEQISKTNGGFDGLVEILNKSTNRY